MQQIRSKSTEANAYLSELKRPEAEDNVKWASRALKDMKLHKRNDWSLIALIGGIDVLSFRSRVAQSHLRNDMLPSYWSDALFLRTGANALSAATAINVPLLQPANGVFASETNGVVEQPFARFADATNWPNIALIALPISEEKVDKKITDFSQNRGALDALEHIVRWLAFAWGVNAAPNPIHERAGLPSACMLEAAFGGAGLDLTPGLETRASCPEAIWTAARHWHDYYVTMGKKSPIGRFVVGNTYEIDDRKALPRP